MNATHYSQCLVNHLRFLATYLSCKNLFAIYGLFIQQPRTTVWEPLTLNASVIPPLVD